jgi:peptidoglycan-N-acetylglucosamine deacetylase
MLKIWILIIGSFFYCSRFKQEEIKVIRSFPTKGINQVAITFDACQRGKPAYFDKNILNYIIENKLPVTIFLSGEFALQNYKKIRELAGKYPFIEFENHSLHHYNHMEKMSDIQVVREIKGNQKIIFECTGRKPLYFRFPAGNYNQHDLEIVNRLGLKVVHWTYASGDAYKQMTANNLITRAKKLTKSGDILIFHINGRGWHTGEAIPIIIKNFKTSGYRFVKLKDVIPDGNVIM